MVMPKPCSGDFNDSETFFFILLLIFMLVLSQVEDGAELVKML